MRKFTESVKKLDIFLDEETLRDILLDYSDSGFKWSISYKLFKSYYNNRNEDWFLPVLSSISRKTSFSDSGVKKTFNDIFDTSEENFPHHLNVMRGYHISFIELFEDILANDKQRGDNIRNFSIPSDKLYTFFKITKDIQDRIETMGYTFLLSVHQNAEFDIIIIEI